MNREIMRVSPEVMDILVNNAWKGNIRELKNALERAVILGEGDTITPESLSDEIRFGDGTIKDPDPTWPHDIRPLKVMINEYVERVLTAAGGNKSEAARLLGITRQRLKRIYRNGSAVLS
jgi:DNA-binding NtrC family response regulator